MCCVIPPASVSTTDVSRIASSSVVLPWSTWPMIVTTGGRGCEVSSASSKASGSSSSSAACLIVTSRSSSAAISSTSSSESDCVAVCISPRPIMILMICGIGTPSACERSRTVTPDWTVTGPVGGGDLRARCFGSRRGRVVAAAAPWRGPRTRRRLSMTTRRLRRPGRRRRAGGAGGSVCSVSHSAASV